MHFRFAKTTDFRRLAEIHRLCAREQPDSFMGHLGTTFLCRYYSVVLSESDSVVLCAVDDQGHEPVIGFAGGTLAAENYARSLRKHALRLAMATIWPMIRRPALALELLSRYRFIAQDGYGGEYSIRTGARILYWGVVPEAKDKIAGLPLFERFLAAMRCRGALTIGLEVDHSNVKVVRIHELLGARVTREILTPDGRSRLFMEYATPVAHAEQMPDEPAADDACTAVGDKTGAIVI